MDGPSGFLNLDKPAGITSHQAVQKVRRAIRSRRVGHGGTLDPAATGVLPILVGHATRLMEFLADSEKQYVATIRLGVLTDTLDAEGRILERRELPADLNTQKIESLVSGFRGQILQAVPAFSAVRRNGKRSYELARKGRSVDNPTRTVCIHRLEITKFEPPELVLNVTCGKGTYIRQLAADIGERLECGAHLKALRRTRVGPLAVENSVTLEQLVRASETDSLDRHILPMRTAVWNLPMARADVETARKLSCGQRIPIQSLTFDPGGPEPDFCASQLAAVSCQHGDLIAVVRVNAQEARPVKVFLSRIARSQPATQGHQ